MNKTISCLAATAVLTLVTAVAAAPSSNPVEFAKVADETKGVTPLCSVEGRNKDLANYLQATLPARCKQLASQFVNECDALRTARGQEWLASISKTCQAQ